MFTIYSADVTGNPSNCSHPHKHVILDEDSLKAAICHDYVCAEYKTTAMAIMITLQIRMTGLLLMISCRLFRVLVLLSIIAATAIVRKMGK